MKASTKSAKNPSKAKKKVLVQPFGIQVLPGRSQYDKDFHPLDFVTHCREGNTIKYICASWGLSDSTIYNWRDQFQEFKEAFEIGRVAFCAFWEKHGCDLALGKKEKGSTMMTIWMHKNLLGYSDQGRKEFAEGNEVAPSFVDKDGEPLPEPLTEKPADENE